MQKLLSDCTKHLDPHGNLDFLFRPNFTVLTISVHEGIPGHHLQVSSMADQDLPDFRRYLHSVRKTSAPFHFPYYTGYIEVSK